MKSRPREKKLSFLKGVLSGKRSISELVRAEPVFIFHYDTQPGQYFISGGAETFDDEAGLHATQFDKFLSEIQYDALLNNPRYNVTLIRVIYE